MYDMNVVRNVVEIYNLLEFLQTAKKEEGKQVK
jgi:hypothetical protein